MGAITDAYIGYHIVRDRIWKLAGMARDPAHRDDFVLGGPLREKMHTYFDLLEDYCEEMTHTSKKSVRDWWFEVVAEGRQIEFSRLPLSLTPRH